MSRLAPRIGAAFVMLHGRTDRSAKVVDLIHNPDGSIQTVDPFVR